MDKDSERPPGVLSDILAGAGVGLLLGVLVGLSGSPVVGGVVVALTAVLTVFLGLDANTGTILGAMRLNGARIAALGLAAVIGVGLGLYARVNQAFRASPEMQMARWNTALPDDPTLAKQMMVYERFDLQPGRLVFGDAPPPEDAEVTLAEGSATNRSVLFSALGDFNVCANLDPANSATADVLLSVYTEQGAPEVLPKIAAIVGKLPDEGSRAEALRMSYDLLCFLQRESPE